LLLPITPRSKAVSTGLSPTDQDIIRKWKLP
jgi:hypothetical protein